MGPGKGGLFAVSSAPDDGSDDDSEDYSSDLEPTDPSDDKSDGSGPFDAYAETVFDTEADPAARSDALRQAILTVLEESGNKAL